MNPNKDLTRRSLLRFGLAAGAAIPAAAALSSCTSGAGGGGALGSGGGAGTKLVIPTNQSPWLNAYKGLVAEYTKETGVQIDLRPFPYDQLASQMTNDIQSGAHAYDIFQIDEPFIDSFYSNGWVQAFTSIDSGWKPDPATNSYDNASWWDKSTKTNSTSGSAFGQPINGNVELLMYRTDLYSSLGLQQPKTWDDVIRNGKAAQQSGKVKYGYVLRTQGTTGGGAQITYDFLPILYSYGGNWFADEGKDWTPSIDNAAGVQAAATLRSLALLGPKDTNTIGQAQAISAMQAGDALHAQLVAASASSMQDQSNSSVVGKVGFLPTPAGSAGKSTAAAGEFQLAVPAGLPADRAQAALKFITWLESAKAQSMFTQLGGIPTRGDVLSSSGAGQDKLAYLTVVQDSNKYLQKHVRYTFAADMLPVTEKYLSQIAAGSISPEQGVSQIAAELAAIVKKAGYPMSGGK
jgi:multiple sugar transport system substrate-binding protein